MSQERSVDTVLKLVVDRLASQPEVALTRIWLVAPGDICTTCHMRDQCLDRTSCLHLVASAGSSKVNGEEWTNLDGFFRRFPFGVRKVGKIASTGEPIEVPNIATNPQWLARPDWAEAEGIRALGGQPLIHQGEVLGVLAVFTRACLGEENLTWMRMIADHAAAAIANARAFEEIAQLKQQLELERDYLRDELLEAHAFGDIVGQSPSLKNVLQQIELVAPTDASVLILGESGTGKELVARALHDYGKRRTGSFVAINMAAMPRTLIESELFGHEKGAFTGAHARHYGRFEQAQGGTLFLDEIGDMPFEAQTRLLRVLQQGEYTRIGGRVPVRSDARIIAATHRDLRLLVKQGLFRDDLFYRINVVSIRLPPLRERGEDIPMLTRHFFALAQAEGLPAKSLDAAAMKRFCSYPWPGNVRELENLVRRLAVLYSEDVIGVDAIDSELFDGATPAPSDAEPSEGLEATIESHLRQYFAAHKDGLPSAGLYDRVVREIERPLIALTLEATRSNQLKAARVLGINRNTLRKKIRELDIPIVRGSGRGT
ncbi:MAG: sigma 54-interacting transcriptional regulator [Proteobacteria bacterium]|nr:sigma 54-interacting transcriptional regulator [Pseudomonadota bacterium]